MSETKMAIERSLSQQGIVSQKCATVTIDW